MDPEKKLIFINITTNIEKTQLNWFLLQIYWLMKLTKKNNSKIVVVRYSTKLVSYSSIMLYYCTIDFAK